MSQAPSALEASGPRLEEASALWWRDDLTPRGLRREERRWTAWTAWIVVLFAAPGVLLLYLEPLTAPVAGICFAHAAESGPERMAIGLLGDLLGHAERDLLLRTGLVLERGELGVWLLGGSGALLVRPGGRRIDCWCVRVGDASELPPADRAAHLLLGLREDELGFAKVANLSFSGAGWRVARRLSPGPRRALAAARRAAR